MAEEFTAKFKVDISDLKKNISQANKEIKLANATFKSETAGMEDWSKNADGLSSKLKQLDSTLKSQKTVLSSYKAELDRQKEAYEENGKRAEELKKKLQDLADRGVSKTDEEYKKYETALKNVTKEQEANEKAVDNLTIQVLNQEAAVKTTEAQVGKFESALQDLRDEENKDEDATKDLDTALDDVEGGTGKANEGFTVMKGVLANLATEGIKLAIDGLKKLGEAAIKAWEDFDEGNDTIIRLTGATGEKAQELQGNFKNVSKQIVADSGDIGTAIGEINTKFGSNGQELDDLSVKYLKFAELNGTDVAGSIDDTQKALAAFGLGAESAEGFLDVLTKTGQDTGASVEKLSDGLVSNATAFQEMGLSLDQSVVLMGHLERSGANSETVLNGMRKALKNSAKEGLSLDDALLALQDQIEGNVDGVDGLNAAYDLFGKSGDQIYGAIKNGTLSFRDLTTAVNDSTGAVDNTYEATLDATDKMKLAMQGLKTEVAGAIDNFLQEHGPQIEAVLKTFTEKVVPALVTVLGGVLDAFSWIIDKLMELGPVLESVGQWFSDTWSNIKAVWGTVSKFFQNIWASIKNTFSAVKTWFSQKFTAAYNAVKSAFSQIGSYFAERWAATKQAFATAREWFSEKFSSAYSAVKEAFANIGSYFSQRWAAVKNAFVSVKTWFGNKFGEAWQAIKDKFAGWGAFWGGLWETVKQKFSSLGTSISNAIGGAIKSGINSVIGLIENTINSAFGLINGAIRLINKLPGVNVGEIGGISLPRLAQGGILRKGQVGLLEGSGDEAVIPLDKNKMWIRSVAGEMLSQLQGPGGSVINNSRSRSFVQNFTQNINAPKAPSRIELYRQTKNLLALAEGRV